MRISEDIRCKVQGLATELGYTFHLRQNTTPDIQHFVFINPWGANDEFYAQILSGAGRVCQQNHISLRFSQIDEATSHLLIHHDQVDAFVFAGTIDEQIIRQFMRLNRPMVLIDNNLPDISLDRVLIENYRSIYRTVKRLAAMGHQKIAYINGPAHPSFLERLSGYRQAMADLGYRTEEIHFEETSFEYSFNRFGEILREKGKPRYTALIGCNDHALIGAMRALQEAGIQAPDDISVVGFDDVSVSMVTNPPISTHHVYRELMGEMAARLLLERISNPGRPTMSLTVDTVYIERGSTRSIS